MNIIRIDHTQADFVVELFNDYRVFYKQLSDLERARNFIQARLDNKESVIYVAIDNADHQQNPMGFTQLYPTYSSVRTIKNWILNDLYVKPAYRKQGVGEALIQTAITFARQNHATTLELSTAVDNFTAQRLYEQIGFIQQSPDSLFYNYKIALSS